MVGGVIGGYSETGRRKTATPPSSMMTNAMTFASTGCSMKNLASMMTPGAGQDSVYHHAIVGSEAVANGATIGRKRTFHDRAPRYDVVALHDIHIISLLIV